MNMNELERLARMEKEIAASMSQFDKIYKSSAFESIRKYSNLIEKALLPYRKIEEQVQQLYKPFLAQQEIIKLLTKTTVLAYEQLLPTTKLLNEQIRILSATAQWEKYAISQYSSIENISFPKLVATSQDFFNLHGQYFEEITEDFLSASMSNELLEYPTLDLTCHRVALQTYYPIDENEQLEIEDYSFMQDEAEKTENNIKSLSNSFGDMLNGVEQSLASNNPDKIRQSITSLRELVTHVLNMIAPDKEIKKWTKKEEHYYNGRPKRNTRIAFICRNITNEKLVKLVENDMKAINLLFDAFNAGTHKLISDYTEEELYLLLFRTKFFINYLINLRG